MSILPNIISNHQTPPPSTKTRLILAFLLLIFPILIIVKNYPLISNSSLLSSASSFSSQILSFSDSTTCDIFDGRWLFDNNSEPIYSPGSCPFVEREFNCIKNGRFDRTYLKYRWQPYGCNIPKFDAMKMMEMLRGKRLVFVGDSLNRNMCQSLICSLKMFKINQLSRSRDFHSYHVQDFNSSIIFITAPFLVQQRQLPGRRDTLRIDTMEGSISKYHDADFLIFNTGHWWNHNKSRNGENFFQEGDSIHYKMDVGVAYTKALNTWANWVDKNVNKNKTQVFFAGYSNTHFQGGDWDTGGSCDKETEPITDEKSLTSYPLSMQTLETVISRMETPVVYLNITRLTDYRKDGHPSKYRQPGSRGGFQDCSHWCLPGVPDSWNQLLYASLLLSLEPSSNKNTNLVLYFYTLVFLCTLFFKNLGILTFKLGLVVKY
ncbi:protein trichome birefringence-like 4 [Amaranthus tricolor]|uniref:protein trichome birefringence-like 4 n=1 Tax=Amaranthus tricolor TaxID=29722 RepID=UPI00258CFA57|nr:protein trichome birefringence-like 4 [Amaranthus tricolor]